jgi:hypothetical protein
VLSHPWNIHSGSRAALAATPLENLKRSKAAKLTIEESSRDGIQVREFRSVVNPDAEQAEELRFSLSGLTIGQRKKETRLSNGLPECE